MSAFTSVFLPGMVAGSANNTAVSLAGTDNGSGVMTLNLSLTTSLVPNYETVAASQTNQIMGATGGLGDYIDHLVIIPGTTSPGAVTLTDGNGSAITIFAGGASSVGNLIPFTAQLGMVTVNATTPGWKVTTGTNVTCIGVGRFT